MNIFPRLLCLATLATAAFAQTTGTMFVTTDPSLAGEIPAATAQPSSASRNTQPNEPAQGQTQADAIASAASHKQLQLRSTPEHITLPTATVLRLKLNHSISTASARPGEQFAATLNRPVEVDGRTIIPAGAIVNCEVRRAQGAHRFAGKPSLSVKALSIRMPDGEELSFTASVVDTSNPHNLDVDQEGNVRGTSTNPMDKVELGSLAGVGAVAGAVIAGPEGFLIGTASGVIVAAGHILIKHHELTLPAGTELIFELDAPAIASRTQMGGMQ
jgi:hypothetical protein